MYVFLLFLVFFFAFPQLIHTAGLPTKRPISRGIALPEAVTASPQLSNRRTVHWLRGLQVQANSQQQVLQQKAPAGQLHLSIANTSQRVQLAQNDSKAWLVEVFPQTQSEFFVSKSKKYIIIHGAGGNYEQISKQQLSLKKYASSIGAKILEVENIVKAHLAPRKLRENCGITTDVGTAILSSNMWNQAEEVGAQKSRDFTYSSDFSGFSFEEIMINKHNQARQEIITKLNTLSNLSSEQLFLNDLTSAGHEEMSYVSAKQLCCYHECLNVTPKEGIFVLYVRDCIAKMQELYVTSSSPVQEAMFYTSGDGRRHVKPGVVLDESGKELDKNYIIGMGICENISSLLAKTTLQTELASIHASQPKICNFRRKTKMRPGYQFAKL